MKRYAIAFLLLALILGGCASKHISQKEMFVTPRLSDFTEVTAITFKLNPQLDVADTMFLYNIGVQSTSFSWKAVIWKPTKKGWDVEELLAVRFEHEGQKFLLVTYPGPRDSLNGAYVGILDHAGRRVYNLSGAWAEVSGSLKSLPKKKGMVQFLTQISEGSGFVNSFRKDQQDFTDLEAYYQAFRKSEVESLKKYVYDKYGVKYDAVVSTEVLKAVEADNSLGKKFVRWLGEDWKVLFTYPLMSVEKTGASMLLAKVFTLPSIWQDEIDKAGYMDRTPTAAETYDMIQYFAEEYLNSQSGNGENSRYEDAIRRYEQELAAWKAEKARIELYNKWIKLLE